MIRPIYCAYTGKERKSKSKSDFAFYVPVSYQIEFDNLQLEQGEFVLLVRSVDEIELFRDNTLNHI